MFSKLIKNQRYLFYKKSFKDNHQIVFFRANYMDILGTTLRVFNYEDDENKLKHNKNMRTLPLEWIVKIETLDEITYHSLLLPSDILVEIDNFT
jgi:hypothetical protein